MRIQLRSKALLASVCTLIAVTAWGQKLPTPAKNAPTSFDLSVTYAPERAQVTPSQCCFWMQGGGVDASVTFWKQLGIAASLTGDHRSDVNPGVDINKFSYLVGPRYTYTAWAKNSGAVSTPRYQIFGQGLFGGVRGFDGLYPASASTVTSSANAFALQAGGGFNYFLTPRWGLRLFEADYVRTQLPNQASDEQNDLRLAFGVTYHLNARPSPPVTLSCAAAPAVVFPGDPVTLTATAGGLDSKLHALYGWQGAGVTGNGATASVNTASLAPGSYAVKCDVKEGKAGKEGLKTGQSAEASTSFAVKAFEPPTVSCLASPNTIKPGDTATITVTGVSPQNRPLTYSYATSAGSIAGGGNSAVFSSTGAANGDANITCSASDDKGQTATANTKVTIVAPSVAPPPSKTQALCAISFAKDKKRPTRVDNEAKACLDEVALTLQKQPDAKAVLVGSASAAEKSAKNAHKRADYAAERAVNAKSYLTTEKGLDAARISVAVDGADEQKVSDYLVPSGATFTADVTGTTPVNEAVVKPQARKPLKKK